jgi:predicted N-acyltransferase
MSIKSKPATVAIRVVSGIGEIRREEWDSLANPGWPAGCPTRPGGEADRLPYNPFLCWDFLEALESSGLRFSQERLGAAASAA